MSRRRLLWILFLLSTRPAWAQLEVIEPRHRGAERVLPTLRPHLSSQGSLSSFADKLVISTDAAKMEALRAIVAAIDQPLRQLLVSVRLEDSAEKWTRAGSTPVTAQKPMRMRGNEKGGLGRLFQRLARAP